MVKKENSVYLFLGEDSFSKAAHLKRLKKEFISPEVEDFNVDTLYAKELSLLELQEKILCLPFKAKRRLIIIKGAQNLKENIREFILNYIKRPGPNIILVLDIDNFAPQDQFVNRIAKFAQTFRFRQPPRLDTFTLSRSIDLKNASRSLQILKDLLKKGEKPERILGGLRYAWENNISSPLKVRRRLKLLLNCDIAIKTGKLRSDFALEKLVVDLCCLIKPSD